jgi:hypothetical protein
MGSGTHDRRYTRRLRPGGGQCVPMLRRHSKDGGIVLRAELVDLGRVLERRDRRPDQNVEILRGACREHISAQGQRTLDLNQA